MGIQRGSVLKETIAVSVTISISAQNRHSRILLRDLLRSRVWEMHWESEVREAEAQVGKWLDCPPLHCVKNGIFQGACSSPKMCADQGKSAPVHTVRLMNSLAQGLTRMVTEVQWLFEIYTTIWLCISGCGAGRSLQRFCGNFQTYRSQSVVFDSLKPCYVKSIIWNDLPKSSSSA